MSAVGTLVRYDEIRGYGFIAPVQGGSDVFVHANDFGEARHQVHPGMRVEYEAESGDRGLKAVSVRLLDPAADGPVIAAPAWAGEPSAAVSGGASAGRGGEASAAVSGGASAVRGGEDEGDCDVLRPRAFAAEVTELLIERVPSLTGEQIGLVRSHLVELARSHGWIEA